MATLASGGRRGTARKERLLKRGEKASVVAVVRSDGRCPADEFLEEVQVAQFASRIEAFCAIGRLRSPELMNKASSGKDRPVVWEIKADKGPGYRLYGVRVGSKFVATHGSPKRKGRELAREVDLARTIFSEWEAAK